MKLVILCLGLMGCAYGSPLPDQKTFGNSRGNSDNSPTTDAGSPSEDDYNSNQIPQGCFINNIIENGEITTSFVVCPPEQFSLQWLVDPPYNNHKDNRQ